MNYIVVLPAAILQSASAHSSRIQKRSPANDCSELGVSDIGHDWNISHFATMNEHEQSSLLYVGAGRWTRDLNLVKYCMHRLFLLRSYHDLSISPLIFLRVVGRISLPHA